jgi:hypothetical protein
MLHVISRAASTSAGDARRATGCAFVLVLGVLLGGLPLGAQRGETAVAPNYDLAAQWTSQKVSKLVFDTTVTPRWLESSDRFWYAYQTRDGRRFTLVDPITRTKAPLFDHARMAATLTTITRIPYDAQHLPFTTVRFVKNDTAFEFDVQIPADASLATPPPRSLTEQSAGSRQGQPDDGQGQQLRTGQSAAAARPDDRLRAPAQPVPDGRRQRRDSAQARG